MMWKAALAGAVALATLGSFSFSQQGFGVSTAVAQEIVVTEGQIARLRGALKLTPAQEHHWQAVAATLRSLAHHQQQYQVASAEGGYVERTQARVAGYTVTAVAMQRLKSAAAPLISVLSEEQKDAGRGVLQSMGMSF
jgi:LTXXQ motif family protein